MADSSNRAHAYPLLFQIHGETVVFRLLDASCRDAVTNFARHLPDEDLLFLERDITQQLVVDQWIAEAEDGRLVTIIAWKNEEIVGYATYERGIARWTQHVAELRVAVTDSSRGRGIGRLLLELAFEMALEDGATKVVARMTPDQTGAVSLFQRLGFCEEAVLRDNAMDANGLTHDLLVLSFHVREQEESRCSGCGAHVLTALSLDGVRLCSHCFETRYEELGGGD